ncbi:hypothetical protein H2204_008710 [Knufia peltigerae]|uniref:Nucleolar 27S pre-rRNA processing Urb2/Npa2 C-terminal domain-containing protein n=1 Tax=Knufia peltigerae TaxID=1002370 RepID=A0AA38XZB4_9EURO|nr:hypothetical protein H2204_008710 [Knufia peltigerae]
MSKPNFESAIAGLEKSTGPPESALATAASTLSIDLEDSIAASSERPLLRNASGSTGFKEQWILRWLLKKLASPAAISSFSARPQFWSLLINLTNGIPRDICLEILVDRKFYRTLSELILSALASDRASADLHYTRSGTEESSSSRPSKKRRLSPATNALHSGHSDKLLWILLQTVCACVELLEPSHAQHGSRPLQVSSAIQISVDDQAILLASTLQVALTIIKTRPGTSQQRLLSQMIKVTLPLWNGDSTSSGGNRDALDQAFSSHCLPTCLNLLDLFRHPGFDYSTFATSKQALERLVAIHVVFPARSTFMAKDARKWKNVHDVLVYEQFEAMLKSFTRRIIGEEQPQQINEILGLTYIILDIAIRSIPSADFRRWQAEQPWIDALFVCLAHVTWPHMPRITSTGVVAIPAATNIDHETSLVALENLVDAASTRNLRLSLPALSYIVAAILALDQERTPWSLLLKTIQLDVNTLVPGTGLSKSGELLKSLLGKVLASEVPLSIYESLRDHLIIPLLRSFARSRNFDEYLVIWQQGLADAMRARYTSRLQPESVPAVLVWDDEDVFDEFSRLSLVHAPKSMGNRLLKELDQAFDEMAHNIGSTADTFAKLAVFSALLQSSQDPSVDLNLDRDRLFVLYDQVVKALSRKSDYQAQRWRLWKIAQHLLSLSADEDLARMGKQLLGSTTHFLSLGEIATYQLRDSTRKRASKFLDALECFSTTIELSTRSTEYATLLEDELLHFRSLIETCAHSQSLEGLEIWSGRAFDCDNSSKLICACIGKLLQNSAIIPEHPGPFGKLIELCFEILTTTKTSDDQGAIQANLRRLLYVLLGIEEIHKSPKLHQLILQHVVNEPSQTKTNFEVHKMLLKDVSEGLVRRSQLKKIGPLLRQRLLRSPGPEDPEVVSQVLALVLLIDDAITESLFDSKDWRAWISLTQRMCEIDIPESSMSMLAVVQMLDHILKLVWKHALSTPQAPALSDLVAWTTKTVKVSDDNELDITNLLSLQVFTSQICLTKNLPDNVLSHGKVRKLRERFLDILKRSLEQRPKNCFILENPIMLELLLRAVGHVQDATVDENAQQTVSMIRDRALARSSSQIQSQTATSKLYVEYKSMQLSTEQHAMSTEEEILAQVQDLASFASGLSNGRSEQLGLLCSKAHMIASRITPAGIGDALQVLRRFPSQPAIDTPKLILTSAIIPHADVDLISQSPRLANELTCIASLDASKCHDMAGLFLSLENCKVVLQTYPLLINQSALDKVLISICMFGTSTLVSLPDTVDLEQDSQPHPVHIFDQCCAIIGIILGRYRRRISDRYHLLLPALQMLMRCLFWPGLETIRNRRYHNLANSLNIFHETLPQWLQGCAESLPPSSAEKLARLFSTICNPSVSAARSAKKGGHNELNDETKRAKQLAGQHMQYIVVEYARCTLDGQILPSVKDRLMPGMYAVLDSMDKELLRAVNAGMDPSSRAIFKNLYDDWSRFGKWDKT